MNKDQRKYLTDWVFGGFEREKKQAESARYERPSLNNYLVAAAMENTLVVKGVESIKAHIRQMVIQFGPNDRLITYEAGGYGRRKNYGEDEFCVTIKASELFEFPAAYIADYEKWRENEREIQEKLAALEGIKSTVLLKVNIGSDKALEDVIAQADSLATLDLVNKKLTAHTPKALSTTSETEGGK